MTTRELNTTNDIPPKTGELNTYRKHGMNYFTKQGVQLRTGFNDVAQWYLLVIRELLDNAIDFLEKYYKGADDCVISTVITISPDGKYFSIKVRNTNYKNIQVLQNKEAIFNYDMTYGSKQYQYIISRGMLGDALKQLLAFGYIMIHLDDDGTSFQDRQWEEPFIISNNGKEFKIYLTVDKARQEWKVSGTEESDAKDIEFADTEIEFMLPLVDEVKDSLRLETIINYCRTYPIFTTDITFKFKIHTDEGQGSNIEYKGLHPISTESWENQNSCHAYMPEEFKSRFVSMDPEESARTRVYDLLKTFREGTNLSLKGNPQYNISIAELCDLPNNERDKRIRDYYTELRKLMRPPPKLCIPYTTNTVKRKQILVDRLRRVYDDLSSSKDASYKCIAGVYESSRRDISFPYFFEMLAIPFIDPRYTDRGVVYTGAVNYSISPKPDSNLFNGDYDERSVWSEDYDEASQMYEKVKDIRGVMSNYGFHPYAIDTGKIPCVIIANLVTPRRDPHGYDKSSIDIDPFTESIVQVVKRLSQEIKSYRARGIYFRKPKERKSASANANKKGALGRMLIQYLHENRGLPIIDTYGRPLDGSYDDTGYNDNNEEEAEE